MFASLVLNENLLTFCSIYLNRITSICFAKDARQLRSHTDTQCDASCAKICNSI